MFRVTVPALKYMVSCSLQCCWEHPHIWPCVLLQKAAENGPVMEVGRSGLTLFSKLSAQEVVLLFLTSPHILHLCRALKKTSQLNPTVSVLQACRAKSGARSGRNVWFVVKKKRRPSGHV